MVKADKLPNGKWRCRVCVGKGKYKTFVRDTKKDAQTVAIQFEATIKGNAPSDDPYIEMTVREAMERYTESKKSTMSPKTYREYTNIARNHFKGLHSAKLSLLTQEAVQIEVSKLSENLSPKSVRNIYGLLSSTIKMFRPDFRPNIMLPQKKKAGIIIPTEDDMKAILRAVKGTEIEIPVTLAAVCGLRMSEIVGMKWKEIDLEKGTLHVCMAKVRDINNKYVEKGTKSRAGDRTLNLTPKSIALLKNNLEEGKEFLTDIKPGNIYKRYQTILSHCCPGKHYTFHELRHYACSAMIMLGIPNKYIADYLGHETEDMVNRVYGHVMQDKKDTFFNRFSEYFDSLS